MNEATATLFEGDTPKTPCVYTGRAELEGAITDSNGVISGEYWEQDGLFLFQNGSKVYEVSDEDIVRKPSLSASTS